MLFFFRRICYEGAEQSLAGRLDRAFAPLTAIAVISLPESDPLSLDRNRAGALCHELSLSNQHWRTKRQRQLIAVTA